MTAQTSLGGDADREPRRIHQRIGHAHALKALLGELVVNIRAVWQHSETHNVEVVKVYPDLLIKPELCAHVSRSRHLSSPGISATTASSRPTPAALTYVSLGSVSRTGPLVHLAASFFTVILTGAAFLTLVIGAH